MAETSLFDIGIIALLAGGVWYFFDAMRAREAATAIAREYCNQSRLQFLDGTVGLRTVALKWLDGRPRLHRRYEFYFCDPDNKRNVGVVTISGFELDEFILPASVQQQTKQTIEA